MSASSDRPISLDPFETGGNPVHCRTLIVDIHADEERCVRALATIADLRKQGWVPTGGELQAAGFVHHMSLDVLVGTESRRIERFEPSQRVVACESSERTGGDSCRDPIHRLRGMVGETLDAGSLRRLGQLFGGPLGCSHLLTLAQLVTSFLPPVLEGESRRALEQPHRREAGERIATRTIVIDGFERREGNLEIAVQLTDLHTLPFSSMSDLLDRLSAQHEVRAIIRVDSGSTITDFDVAERLRIRTGFADARWQSRREELDWLGGQPALGGLASQLRRRHGADSAREPLLAALLNFAPGLVQCLSTRATDMLEQEARRHGRLMLPGGADIRGRPDSCYMWRTGGRMPGARRVHDQD